MDVNKLEGIVSAIEGESKAPAPSHANLARLVSMFFRELIEQFKSQSVEPKPAEEIQEPVNSDVPEKTKASTKASRRK